MSAKFGCRWCDCPKEYGPSTTVSNHFNLRKHLRRRAIVRVIPGRSKRKRQIRYDAERYKSRHLIKNAFGRLQDSRRIASRYDKLARNLLSAVALATLVSFWL